MHSNKQRRLENYPNWTIRSSTLSDIPRWEMKNLRGLEMSICPLRPGDVQRSDVIPIGQGLKELKQLQHLEMNFSFCSKLADVSSIGQGLKELKNLQHMNINFSRCFQLADVSSIGQGLEELKNLRYMELDFRECDKLLEVSSIGQGLNELTSLTNVCREDPKLFICKKERVVDPEWALKLEASRYVG